MAESSPPPPLFPNLNETIEICIDLPPKINSNGIWENTTSPSVFLKYSLPLFELQVILIFLVTNLVYAILKPLGSSFFAAQMFVGIILGSSMLGKLEAFQDIMFSPELSLEYLNTAAVFGFTIFLFMMTVKIDVNVAFTTSRRAVVIGIVSFISPLVAGLVVYTVFNDNELGENIRLGRLLGLTTNSLTSFSVIACNLGELNIINSELGRMALSSAVVNDMFHVVLLYLVNSLKRWQKAPALAIGHFAVIVIFILVIFLVFRPLMFWIIKTTPEDRPPKGVYIVGIVIAALGCGLFTHLFSLSPFLGVFIFGLAVPDGPPLGSALIDKFEAFAYRILLPVYVTIVSMSIDLNMLISEPSRHRYAIVLVVVTFLAKLISCFLASFRIMPFKDSISFALIMSSKGIMELSYFATFRDQKVISERLFSVLSLSVLVNATLIPILVKFLYNPVSRKYTSYEKRNLMHLKPDAELRILSCIYRPENVPDLIGFLDLTCPTKESPIIIYVLNLIKLIGRDSPIFITHKRQQGRVGSCFQHHLYFNQYERQNFGLVTVNAFTAISPSRLMHEDINIMALDKKTPFLILPFHRKLSSDGSIDFENNEIRNLNCTVLDRSPCSIGILVGRGVLGQRKKSINSSSSSTYSIAMLFLGGKDDREALILAKRMARDPRVKLTVIHLIADQDGNNVIDWETMLDTEMLKDIKLNEVNNDHDILYIQQVSNNGHQAANIVRSIAYDYDMFIVGRRYGVESVQTIGLSEWSEFPELGVFGDLLASSDFNRRVSVLVVQQQHYMEASRH